MASEPLDLSDLDKFARIAEVGSFARSAAELGVSQPALSKTIARLERRIGVRLLERRARGVVPSPYGEVLLRSLLPALADLQAAMQDIDSMKSGKGGVVSIGVSPSAASHFMPKVTEKFIRSRRQISLNVVEGLVDDLLEKVRSGKLDFAVTTRIQHELSGDLIAQNLYRDTFVVCCGANHPLARKRDIVARELCEYLWVLAPRPGIQRSEFDKNFKKQGISPPSAIIQTSSGTLSKNLVIQQGFLSLLPKELIGYEEHKGDIVRLRVPWLEWERQVSLIRRQGKILSGAESFIQRLLIDSAKD